MRERALYSEYIIDGVQQTVTPAQMLDGCCGHAAAAAAGRRQTLVDETVDIAPSAFVYEEGKINEYLTRLAEKEGESRSVPLPFAASYTCGRIAEALIDTLPLNGHFRLEDLTLRAEWKWEEQPVGHLAAFYRSVEAAGEYIDNLGLRMKSYSYARAAGCSLAFKAGITPHEDEAFEERPRPTLGRKRLYPAALLAEPTDWIVYIPFDTCDFRLGGSLLSEVTGARSTLAPDIADADYFMDCFEVVRELAEDGIVKAGATVREGGLLAALRNMCTRSAGAAIGIGDIRKAYGGELPVRVLFSEVPGVILQVSDLDYDYIDAEFLLQDVAYFPIGHPVVHQGGISVNIGDKTGIEGILESLLNSRASEGED